MRFIDFRDVTAPLACWESARLGLENHGTFMTLSVFCLFRMKTIMAALLFLLSAVGTFAQSRQQILKVRIVGGGRSRRVGSHDKDYTRSDNCSFKGPALRRS